MVQLEMFEEPTHIVVILDKSGSMETTKNDTIGGFNRFLDEQKALPGEATMTLIQFDTTYTVCFEKVPVRSVKHLHTETYRPGGGTALLDSAHRGIGAGGAGKKVVVVMITDGEENASQYTRKDQLKRLIEEKQGQGWMFVYLGTHAGAFHEGSSYGVYTSNVGYTPTMAHSFAGASANTTSYRTTGSNVADLKDFVVDTVTADQPKSSTTAP